MRWTLTDAKNRLSEVLDRADDGEMQTITRRGREFVLLPAESYRRLAGEVPSFVDYLIEAGPHHEDSLERMPRDAATPRDPFSEDDDQAAA